MDEQKTMRGQVMAVVTTQRGSVAVSASGTTLSVIDASDFSRDGGWLLVDTEPAPRQYLSVQEGSADGDPDQILLATSGASFSDERQVTPHPPSYDTIAEVKVDSEGSVPCSVPHTMRAVFADGIRDASAMEWVTIAWQDNAWVVLDVDGESPQITIEAVPADTALADKLKASSGFFDTLRAGIVDGTVVQGADIYSPHQTAVPRTQMDEDGFAVIRGTQEEPYTSTQLGGDEGDSLLLTTPGGDVFGFTGGGDLVGRNGSLTSLDLGGRSVLSELDSVPRLVGVYPAPNCSSTPAGSSETGQFDVAFDVVPGQLHRIVFDGYVTLPANTKVQLAMRAVSASVEGADATTPTIANSVSWATGVYQGGSTAGVYRVHLEHFFTTPYLVPVQHRVLLTIRNLTANAAVNITNAGVSGISVETLGPAFDGAISSESVNRNTGGVAPFSGTQENPTSSKKTHTTVWRASAANSWKLGGTYSSPLYTGNYNGDQRWAWVLFGTGATSSSTNAEVGKTLQQALSGSTNVSGYLRMKCTHTHNSGGSDVLMRWHNQSSTPSNFTNIGTLYDSSTSHWNLGVSQRAVSSTVISALASGNRKGIVLGSNSGQANLSTYAQFSAALSDTELVFTYTK